MNPVIPHCQVRAVSSFAAQNLLYCDAFGQVNNPAFWIGRNFFNNYLVMYVDYGHILVEEYGETHTVHEGETIIMSLKDPHTYYFERSCPSQITWFHFNGHPADALMNPLKYTQALPVIVRLPDVPKRINRLFDLSLTASSSAELDIAAAIYPLILYLLEKPLLRVKQQSDGSSDFKESVTQFIQANIDKKLTLDLLSVQAKMSKSAFCAIFKETFGMTPFTYIAKIRVNVAKQLLLCTNLPICEIANYLQFHDQSYFTNTFHRITGMTPGQFRKEHSHITA